MHTALYPNQMRRKAKFISFAGFSLPVWYQSIQEEHLAVRQSVGIFDISHMGVFMFTSQDSFSVLSELSCNQLDKIKEQSMVYSMFLNEQGYIIDDVMIGGLSDNKYLLIVNAANKPTVLSWIKKNLKKKVLIEDCNIINSFVAVQGPKTAEVLSKIIKGSLDKMKRFEIGSGLFENHRITLLRTGYTGEDGFECLVPNPVISDFWEACIEEGAVPCGLGARDTLRIEKGLPLYGQELSDKIDPLMTRYPWVVKWGHNFIGKTALMKRKKKQEWTTIGLKLLDRKIPRPNQEIKQGGFITSGTLSPSLNEPIAMAIVKKKVAKSKENVQVNIRGQWVDAKQVDVPFI